MIILSHNWWDMNHELIPFGFNWQWITNNKKKLQQLGFCKDRRIKDWIIIPTCMHATLFGRGQCRRKDKGPLACHFFSSVSSTEFLASGFTYFILVTKNGDRHLERRLEVRYLSLAFSTGLANSCSLVWSLFV